LAAFHALPLLILNLKLTYPELIRGTLGLDAELSKTKSRCLGIGDSRYLLIHHQGRYHALDHCCTHKSASLCNADIRGKKIICPWHGVKFDIETGQATGEIYCRRLETWPVSIDRGNVYLHI
jgi:nitrite reductase/ring-hydroxylating ferredoxin subunit